MSRRTLRQNSSGPLIRQSVDSASSDSQLEYFIDPDSGSDNFPGTEEQPLQTLGELGRRLSYSNISVSITATILATAPAGDRLELKAITTTADGRIHVRGQTAPTGIVLPIASVTNRSFDAGGPPWEIQTVGVDWTTETRRRLRVQSTGQIIYVGRVLAADTVVVSGNCNESSIPTALTTSDVLELEDDPPTIDAPLLDVTQPIQSIVFANFPTVLEDFVLRDTTDGQSTLDLNGSTVALGCKINIALLQGIQGSTISSSIRNSWFALNGSNPTLYPPLVFINGCVLTSSSAVPFNVTNQSQWGACYFNGVSLTARGPALIALNDDLLFENCNDPLRVFQYACFDSRSSSSPPTGSDGNTGSGVRTEAGGFFYYNGTKPDIAGATQINLGGATTTWAAAPIVDTTLNTGVIDK